MDYISTLPSELLQLVLEKLPEKEDLKSHVLVSRKFYDIARPLIYRECTVGYSTVPLLTEDVALKPDMAKNVQVLNIIAMDMGVPASSFERFRKTLDEAKEVSTFLNKHAEGTFERAAYNHLSNKVDVSFKLFWLSMLPGYRQDVYLALLLSLLPALKVIRINLDCISDQENSFLKLALENMAKARSGQPLQILGNLRVLEAGLSRRLSQSYRSGLSPSYTSSSLAPLLGAPCLTKLTILDLNSPRMLSGLLPSASTITSIAIDADAVAASFLSDLIRSCSRLEVLDIVYRGRPSNLNSWFKTVTAAVCTRAATLQVLNLSTQSHDDGSEMAVCLNDMTGFAKLRSLKIPEHALLGSPPHDTLLLGNILPRSLQKLYMTQCTPMLLDSVKSIVSAGTHSFLKLQKIFAEFDRVAPTIDDSVMALAESMVELQKLYQELMGVELRWTMTTLTSLIADAELDAFFAENIQG